MGIPLPMQRVWAKCSHCGFLKCTRNYDIKTLDGIYDDGYRATEFRGEELVDTFKKIMALPIEQSENKQRVAWFRSVLVHTHYYPFPDSPSILDVGAGFGVFLTELCFGNPLDTALVWRPCAFEPNEQAAELVRKVMGCRVWATRYQPGLNGRTYDFVSCIHTLEHMERPEDFLVNVRENDLLPGGKIFLEVPDAIEFDYLPGDHDEFNSCHLCFYTPDTLYRLVESAGYKVTDINRSYHSERSLSRIRLVATA